MNAIRSSAEDLSVLFYSTASRCSMNRGVGSKVSLYLKLYKFTTKSTLMHFLPRDCKIWHYFFHSDRLEHCTAAIYMVWYVWPGVDRFWNTIFANGAYSQLIDGQTQIHYFYITQTVRYVMWVLTKIALYFTNRGILVRRNKLSSERFFSMQPYRLKRWTIVSV